jgi:predicted YcjX-like family ATPase
MRREKKRSTLEKKKKTFGDSFKRNVAVIGLGNCGKTVFITSLLDQIFNSGFQNSEGVRVAKVKEITLKQNTAWEKFNYKQYRNHISVNAEWPEKTGVPMNFALTCRRKDFDKLPLELKFYDIPGERIADSAMMSLNYLKWSDWILDTLKDEPDLLPKINDYISFAAYNIDNPEKIIVEYKKLLTYMVCDFRSLITPSSFDLAKSGNVISGAPKDWIDSRYIGADNESEFAPLPSELIGDKRDKTYRVFRVFSANYNKYKKEVVQPIFKELSFCDCLLVLVDLPGLLNSSLKKYADAHALLKMSLTACKPRNSLVTEIINTLLPYKWKLPGITQVALIGTKADLVAREDADETYLRLLAEMAGQDLADLTADRIKAKIFTCAAVNSTKPGEKEGTLMGHLTLDESGLMRPPPKPNDDMLSYQVSRLPSQLPSFWDVGDYSFPSVYPLMPRRPSLPPKQEGLWDIFNFICEV